MIDDGGTCSSLVVTVATPRAHIGCVVIFGIQLGLAIGLTELVALKPNCCPLIVETVLL